MFESIIQAAFEVCDWDGNGVLVAEDMTTVGAILGQAIDSAVIKELVKLCEEIQAGGDGGGGGGGGGGAEGGAGTGDLGMDFKTFAAICSSFDFSIPGDRSGTGIRSLRRAFEELDLDNSYSLEQNEITRALKRLVAPRQLTDKDLATLLHMMDDDGNGAVSWQEFVLALAAPKKQSDPTVWKLFTVENLNYTPCHLADVGGFWVEESVRTDYGLGGEGAERQRHRHRHR